MNMTENTRFIKGLRRLGWTDTEINDFTLYLEEGDETFFINKGISEKSEAQKEISF